MDINIGKTVGDILAAYQAAATKAASLKDGGLSVDEITAQLKSQFDPSQVAQALKGTFNMTVQQVTQTMKDAGYAGQDVALALKNTFGEDTEEIANALQSAYGWTVDTTAQVLNGVGFTVEQIGYAFRELGGDFASAGQSILDWLENTGCVVM